jgi:hypothetical protein
MALRMGKLQAQIRNSGEQLLLFVCLFLTRSPGDNQKCDRRWHDCRITIGPAVKNKRQRDV